MSERVININSWWCQVVVVTARASVRHSVVATPEAGRDWLVTRRHLTLEERAEIEVGAVVGETACAIAARWVRTASAMDQEVRHTTLAGDDEWPQSAA